MQSFLQKYFLNFYQECAEYLKNTFFKRDFRKIQYKICYIKTKFN